MYCILKSKTWNYKAPWGKCRGNDTLHWSELYITKMYFWLWHQKDKQQMKKWANGTTSTKKLLHSKINSQKKKKKPMEWEKIFTNQVSDKGLISKVYQELLQLSSQNNSIWFIFNKVFSMLMGFVCNYYFLVLLSFQPM